MGPLEILLAVGIALVLAGGVVGYRVALARARRKGLLPGKRKPD